MTYYLILLHDKDCPKMPRYLITDRINFKNPEKDTVVIEVLKTINNDEIITSHFGRKLTFEDLTFVPGEIDNHKFTEVYIPGLR